MEDKSHLTATSRKLLPLPTRRLLERGMIVGRTLDYGCGRCHELNNRFFYAEGYDPHHKPELPTGQYETIICNFVLNVLPTQLERGTTIHKILDLLSPTGTAYFAVRNDIKRLNGLTKRGTWQSYVVPPGELIHSCPTYRLYRLTKDPSML